MSLLNVARQETARALKAKERGNDLYRAGRFHEAVHMYSLALALAPPACELRNSVHGLAHVRAASLSNRAAALLALGWHVPAVLDASSASAEIAFATNVRRLENIQQRRKLHQLLKKVHTRRARAYHALGIARRARQDDHFVAMLSTKAHQTNEGTGGKEATPNVGDNGTEVSTVGCCDNQGATLPWNVREDWAACVEKYLGPADLGRLRRVNRSWRLGVQSNSDAWKAAEHAVLGALKGTACSGSQQQRVPRMMLTLLGCPPPLVIELGTGYTKCGFAGQLAPSCLLGNFTVRDRISQAVQIVDVGGVVAEGVSLVQFLNAAVFEPLHVDPAYHPMLVVLSSHLEAATACIQGARCTTPDTRVDVATQRLVDTLRKQLGAPAVKKVHSAETALQRLGLETGVVVDIGLGMTRACPVVDGKVVREGIQAQFIGAANVTNMLLQELQERPDVQQAFSESNMSGFEVMLCVKAMKEEQLAVASSTVEALRDCPCTTDMLPLSTATGRRLFCSNELLKAAEMFFAPTRIRGSDAGYFGSDVPAPTKGLHELVLDAADYLPKVEHCDVVLIGGTAQTVGMRERLQAELDSRSFHRDTMIRANVHPVLPDCGWSGGSLIGTKWDWTVQSDAVGNDDMKEKGATIRSQSARLRGYRPTWSAETDGGTYTRAATSSIFCKRT